MKDNRRRTILYIVNISLCVLLVAFIITAIVYAEYTKSTIGRRVVAPRDTEGLLFSSNLLAPTEPSSNHKVLYTKNASNDVRNEITICNYAQGNPGFLYDHNIEYHLFAKLVKPTQGGYVDAISSDIVSGYDIKLKFKGQEVTFNSAKLSHTFSNSILNANIISTDNYLLTFDKNFNDGTSDICIQVSAELVGNYPGISNLNAIFSTAVSGAIEENHWEGYFSDSSAVSEDDTTNPSELDGFNYTITGSGIGTIKLSWLASALEVNQLFLLELGETPSEETISGVRWKYIEFEVDSNITSRYDFQIYRVFETTDSFASWEIVKEYVKFEYTKPA